MLNLQIQTFGFKEAQGKLKKLHDSFGNWRPEFNMIGDALKQYYEVAVFATEGAILGTPWAKLLPTTAYAKAKKYPGRGILERTGKLKKSYKYRAFDDFMVFANTAPYAIYHQKGTFAMPSRLVIFIDQNQKNIIMSKLQEGVANRILAAAKA